MASLPNTLVVHFLLAPLCRCGALKARLYHWSKHEGGWVREGWTCLECDDSERPSLKTPPPKERNIR